MCDILPKKKNKNKNIYLFVKKSIYNCTKRVSRWWGRLFDVCGGSGEQVEENQEAEVSTGIKVSRSKTNSCVNEWDPDGKVKLQGVEEVQGEEVKCLESTVTDVGQEESVGRVSRMETSVWGVGGGGRWGVKFDRRARSGR